ncbi:hypothetical protein [Paracoccus amoyensis]|nr:hypothetical protein [Paracoccus amoyensis]
MITPLRPAARMSNARLFLTTALIGVMPMVLIPTKVSAQEERYYDPRDTPFGGVDPRSGYTWNADNTNGNADEYWSDENGENHTVLGAADTGILTEDTGLFQDKVDITLSGQARLAGLIVRGDDDYSITGDGTGRLGFADADTVDAVRFDVENQDTTLNIGVALGGAITIAGQGTVAYDYTGNRGLIQSVAVEDGATFRNRGITKGLMTVQGGGTVVLRDNGNDDFATHVGAIRVQEDGVLELDGDDASDPLVADDADTTAVEQIINDAGGTINVISDSVVATDIVNNGRIYSDASGTVDLDLTGHQFTNTGVIETESDFDQIRILADRIVLQQTDVDNRNVTLVGDIVNNVTLALTRASDLYGQLTNNESGIVDVSAAIDGSDDSISNSGTINVLSNGSLRDLVQLDNSGTLTVAAGSGNGDDLSADLIENRGVAGRNARFNLSGRFSGDLNNRRYGTTTLSSGSEIFGDILNEGTLEGSGVIDGTLTNANQVRVNGELEIADLKNAGVVDIAGNGGNLVLTSGDFVNEAGGIVRVNGNISRSGNSSATVTNMSGGQLVLRGGMISADVQNDAGGQVILRADTRIDAGFENAGSLDNVTGNDIELDISGNTFANRGEIKNSGTGGTTSIIADEIRLEEGAVNIAGIDFIGDIINQATLLYSTAAQLNGGLTNTGAGNVVISRSLDANGNDITNEARMVLSTTTGATGNITDAGIVRNEGILAVEAGAEIEADEVINLRGTDSADELKLDGGTITAKVTNRGAFNATGTVDGDLINERQLTLLGRLDVDRLENSGDVHVGGGDVLNSDENISNSGRIHLIGSGVINVTGANSEFLNESGGTLRFSGGTLNSDLTNESGGIVNITGDSTIDGNFENLGTIKHDQAGQDYTLTIADGGEFIHDGNFIGGNGTLTIDAANIILRTAILESWVTLNGNVSVENDDAEYYRRAMTLPGSITNRPQGEIYVWADVDGDGHSIYNQGLVSVELDPQDDDVGRLHNLNELLNQGEGRIRIAAGTSASANVVQNNGNATIVVAGTLDSTTTALLNTADATVTLAGGRVLSGITNQGELTGAGTVDGTVTNTGSVVVTGAMTLGSLDNQNEVSIERNGVLNAGATVENAGTMTIAGRLAGGLNNLSGHTVNLTGGRIAADLTNSGTVNGRGQVDGVIRNNANARFTTTGRLATDRLINEGRVDIAADTTLVSANGVTNRNQLNLNGTLQGRLRNEAGATTRFGADSKIDGTAKNDGTITGNVDISRELTNTGTARINGEVGTIANTDTGRLSTTGNLSTDSLTNDGVVNVRDRHTLTSTGDITNNKTMNVAGSVTVTGNDSALVNNSGAKLNLDGATLTGNVENKQGALLDILNSSTVVGNLTNTGTMDNTSNNGNVVLTVEDGTFTNSGIVGVTGGGRMTIMADDIELTATSEIDASKVALIGSISNSGTLSYSKNTRLTGNLNNSSGIVRINARVDAQNDGTKFNVTNGGKFYVGGEAGAGALVNVNVLTNRGDTFVIADNGRVTADEVNNSGSMTVAGQLRAPSVNNTARGTLRLTGGNIVGNVDNAGRVVGSGKITGVLNTSGIANVARRQTLEVTQGARNSGTMTVAGNFIGAVTNQDGGTLKGGGKITGDVKNAGTLSWNGIIQGDLTNTGAQADISNRIEGDLWNAAILDVSDDLYVGGKVTNGSEQPTNNLRAAATPKILMTVKAGSTLTANEGIANQSGATLANNGRIIGDITNDGVYNQNGTLRGDLIDNGEATINGRVNGTVHANSSAIVFRENASIQQLNLNTDYKIDAGQSVRADTTRIAKDSILTLAGGLDGAVNNQGTIQAAGNAGSISGKLHNDNTVSMTEDSPAYTTFKVGGLSGTGTYKFDLDLSTGQSDTIVVDGGAATGTYNIDLATTGANRPRLGTQITLIDVDDSLGDANSYNLGTTTGLASGNERIVYAVQRAGESGDLKMVTMLNPAIGSLIGNVTLTQTLIGSIVNRPTSPFVTGLAFEDAEKPCGVGAWGRATGGTVDATGSSRSSSGYENADSTVTGSYYGMQVGSDLACFDDRFAGWDLTVGVLGGVNQGDTNQPVYAPDTDNVGQVTSELQSYTKTDFTQVYGGIYGTATKDRFQADLQIRAEKTDFTIENIAVSGSGLGLDKQDFTSDSTTISGSLGYAFPIGKKGWSVMPTAGFAWSSIKTDSIKFTTEEEGATETLSFEDSNRVIGHVGATVAKTFVDEARNSALYAFATSTVYHDFADPTVSIYTRVDGGRTDIERIEADNLGTFGEISLGANYIKVLDEGSFARQFSTSARIDARFGDGLDSVGVTGQIRWQF